MVVTPNSRIRLLKSPIELDEKNQLTFTNLSAQTNYFLSLPYLEYDNCSYQRKEGVIRYQTEPNGITYEDLLEYNYCMYQNTYYDTKWFYAFITDIKYVNDGLTEIKIETDVMETWKFDIIYKPSFVEREHVAKNLDIRGAYLIPENLETGEYVSQFVSEFSSIGDSHVVMASNVDPTDGITPVSGGTYGNIFSGVKYYVFKNTALNDSLLRIANNGNSNMIVSLFYCPDIITGYNTITFTNDVAEVTNLQASLTSIMVPLTPSTIDGYTPKNAKVFTYPYVGYLLSNNAGGSITYHLEDFQNSGNNLGEIKVRGTCTPGCSIRAYPVNYRCKSTTLGDTDNNEYGLNLGKFPVCSYQCDSYINWLTQNGMNIATNIAESGIGMLTNASNNNPDGTVSNAFGIFNSLNQIYQHSFNPVETRGNLNSGDVTYTIGKLTFTGYMMTIKYQFAKAIDDYFTMFGYKVNTLKVPDFESRTNWNYIKTIGINITGDIPQNDMQKIKDIFDNGITFWHNPSTFLDYSQSNN